MPGRVGLPPLIAPLPDPPPSELSDWERPAWAARKAAREIGEALGLPPGLSGRYSQPFTGCLGWYLACMIRGLGVWGLEQQAAWLAAAFCAFLRCIGFAFPEPAALRLGWSSAPPGWRPYAGAPDAAHLRAHPSTGPPAWRVARRRVPVSPP